MLLTTYAWTTDLHMWVKTDETTYYYPAASEAIESIHSSDISNQKMLRDGQLFIESNGKMYNAQGAEVK